MVVKIGLTGGIASGKSMVAGYLNALGVKTLDADDLTHRLLAHDEEVKAEIRSVFGDGVFDNGAVDRKKLGAVVFADADKRDRLEKIIHPRVRKLTDEFFEANTRDRMAVAVVPLIFEKELSRHFDSVWLVMATAEQQAERLHLHRGLSHAEAEARMKSQMPMEEKLALLKKLPQWAVIDNTGTLENTEAQVRALVAQTR